MCDSDIFSFGSLLYEMVTGHRAFQRDTAASTLAAVLREEAEARESIRARRPATTGTADRALSS